MSVAAPAVDVAVAAAKPCAQAGRLELLDGLRGWAAFGVVLFHVFWETFGEIFPGFRNPITGFLCDGRLAVSVFFVLSGEALSAAFFAGKGDASTIRLAIKRYPRLAIPILASCLIVYLFDRYGLAFNQEAAAIVHRSDWMGDWLRFPLSFSHTLRYALWDVFVSADYRQAVNPMLWTMKIELMGSFFIFALLLAWKRLSRPRLLVLVLFVATAAAPMEMANYLSCFLAGLTFADWRARGFFAAAPSRFGWAPLAAAGAFAAADGLLHAVGCDDGKATLAVLLLLAIYSSPLASRFFACGLSRALGRISFPLYLIQFPVLLSLTGALIVRAGAAGPLSLAAVWGVSLASVTACLLAAIAFEPIEAVARSAGDALVALVRPKRSSRWALRAPAPR